MYELHVVLNLCTVFSEKEDKGNFSVQFFQFINFVELVN